MQGNLPKPLRKQREVLYMPEAGHSAVLGTAGSGKTTLALYRAAYLSAPDMPHSGRTLLDGDSDATGHRFRGLWTVSGAQRRLEPKQRGAKRPAGKTREAHSHHHERKVQWIRTTQASRVPAKIGTSPLISIALSVRPRNDSGPGMAIRLTAVFPVRIGGNDGRTGQRRLRGARQRIEKLGGRLPRNSDAIDRCQRVCGSNRELMFFVPASGDGRGF